MRYIYKYHVVDIFVIAVRIFIEILHKIAVDFLKLPVKFGAGEERDVHFNYVFLNHIMKLIIVFE